MVYTYNSSTVPINIMPLAIQICFPAFSQLIESWLVHVASGLQVYYFLQTLDFDGKYVHKPSAPTEYIA